MINFSLYVVTPILAFIGGFLFYVLTLKFVWDESIAGDMRAVLFWGGIAFFAIAVPIYFGVIYFIDRRFVRFKVLLYPIVCMLIFFIPTLVIAMMFGSLNPFSPEAMLFNSFFIGSGLIFGLSFWIIKRYKARSVL
ncbi:hypothetical protein [Sporosarcina obsidiansis]|uniref:hypothetical protein n=1 Tax=Sporosarcina obsidiansis TaxID=2660748 RepID=UPI00129B661B|nr:hypothetical protein [Sporosarcina obsidiansis]